MSRKQISNLQSIANKPVRNIIGLMSGTSMDGLDIAVCQISGAGKNTSVTVLYFETVIYESALKDKIFRIFAKKDIDFVHLCQMHAFLGTFYATTILRILNQLNIQPSEIDLIASHGQTVQHVPQHSLFYPFPSTFQIADGDHIAQKTGIITLSDFRQKHIAAGGEGAPLAMYGDILLFSDTKTDRILLNLGGISNFTYLPVNSKMISTTDTGPANTLIDQYCQKYLNLSFDLNGERAQKGKIIPELLHVLKKHDFFSQPFPKSTGQEMFNLLWVEKIISETNMLQAEPEDIISTLTQLTVDTITEAVIKLTGNTKTNIEMFVSGGGAHNKTMLNRMSAQLTGVSIKPFEDLGILPDAKEAVLFAVLANECIAGDFSLLQECLPPGMPKVSFGKISLPD
jgi:anhydro-N-acetylmuramic acid kinase